jgi:hypothetical protein
VQIVLKPPAPKCTTQNRAGRVTQGLEFKPSTAKTKTKKSHPLPPLVTRLIKEQKFMSK